jgi:membrane associated rhomboid family serine protease
MQQPVEVFRAAQQRACDERAFMLMAVGIESEVDAVADGFVLCVEQPMLAHARHHLWQYEQERQRSVPVAKFEARPGAWRGSLIYMAVLLLPPIALAQGWIRGDPYMFGVLEPALVMAGEWWRALTALTLHWDASHLLGNLGGGALLGYCAAQVWGSARAWLLILLAAIVANLIEAGIGMRGYVSAGASTAVFAALGLVVASAWRERGRHFASWARWAPLVAGVALLGFFGAGSGVQVAGLPHREVLPFADEGSTNVVSHLLGFACGVLAGVLVTTQPGERLLRMLPAWSAVVLTVVPLVLAWVLALGR